MCVFLVSLLGSYLRKAGSMCDFGKILDVRVISLGRPGVLFWVGMLGCESSPPNEWMSSYVQIINPIFLNLCVEDVAYMI